MSDTIYPPFNTARSSRARTSSAAATSATSASHRASSASTLATMRFCSQYIEETPAVRYSSGRIWLCGHPVPLIAVLCAPASRFD